MEVEFSLFPKSVQATPNENQVIADESVIDRPVAYLRRIPRDRGPGYPRRLARVPPPSVVVWRMPSYIPFLIATPSLTTTSSLTSFIVVVVVGAVVVGVVS